MKTLTRHIYSIKEKLASLNVSDDIDTLVDNEFVADILADVNTKLIQEAYQKNMLTYDLYTPMCCLEVKCATESECTIQGITVPSSGIIHYVEIDNLVQGVPLEIALRYLGLSDYQSPIYIAKSLPQFATWQHRGISKHKPVGFLIGTKMYLKNLEYFTSSVTFLCMLGLIAQQQDICSFIDDETPYRSPDPMKLEYLAFQQIAIALNLRAGDEINNTNADRSITPQQQVPQQQQE